MSRMCRFGGALVLALASGVNAVAGLVTDNFGAAQNYAADGVAGTVWDGFFYNVYGGNATVAAADANTSNAGRLTFRSTFGNWERGDNDGVLLYRTVAGDFDAMLQVVSMNATDWHDAGLMARVAETNDAGVGEDWVAVKHFAQQNNNGHRSTDGGVSSTVQVGSPAQPWLRLTRSGNTFTTYRSTDGKTWSQIGASGRADMSRLPMQVGVWQATFSANEGVAQFDNFSLRTPSTWVLATGGSWPTPGNWTNGVPVGQADWAIFSTTLLTNGSVTLDDNQAIGRLTFITTNATAYSIDSGASAPASTLTLCDTYEGFGSSGPSIEVHAGSHAITAPVTLSNGVTVTTATGTGLTVSGGFSGNGDLVKAGAGMLTLSGTNAYSGATQVQGGTLKLAAIPTGTRVYYTFDNAGSLWQDSSGQGNDLTAVGAPAYAESGKFGGAVYLNGSSSFTRSVFPAGVPTGSSPYTIALWEKSDGSPDRGGFIGWGSSSGFQCNNFRLNGNNQLMNYWYGSDWTVAGLSTNPKDGNWHHLVVTWDGATQRMYVDGDLVGTYAHTGLNAQAMQFVVGRTTADVAFKGWLDEVLVADRAFDLAEIRSLMLSAKPDSILPELTSLQVAAGATLYLNGASQSVAALSGGGRVMNGTQAAVTLTVGGDGSSSAFSGTFDGAIAVAKVGAGTLTLSGLSAYSGGTTVSGGRLVLRPPSLQSVLAGSLAWYDASDAATLTTNEAGQVTLWANKGAGGSDLNAVQIAEGAGPTMLSGGLNGMPVLSLDGTNGLRSQINLGISGAQDRTVFAVGCRKNNGTMCFAHIGNGTNNQAFGIISQPEYLFNYSWGMGKDILFAARPNNAYEIYDFTLSASYGTANLISGGVLSSGELALTPNTVDTPLYLGSRFAAAGQGNLAEVLVYSRALTLAERMGVEAYLRAKWFSAGSSALSAGQVNVAEGAVLDLDGTAQTLSGLSGKGLVTNGTLAVSGDIAPGGTNAVGTLTLAGVAPLSGTLRVDVEADGDCDLLKVEGALDFIGVTLHIQDVSQLKVGNRYVIASCSPGGLYSPFNSDNLGASNWKVSYHAAAGEVCLVNRGLLIMVK
jgi:autotransporter-associated beta strand protein